MRKTKLLMFSVVFTVMLVGSFSVPAAADYTSGNDELLDAMNAALTAIVNDGTYDTIYSHWFSGDVVLTDDSDANTATAFPKTYDSEGTLGQVIANGKIIFGSDTAYPPFEFMSDDGVTVIGFDAEIADAIAAKLSVAYSKTITATMQTNDWDSIIPDLKAGTFDAILSAMTKTAERAQEVQFTRSYYTSKQGILVPDASSISSIEAVNNSGLNVGLQSGTTSDIYAESHLTGVTVHGYTTIDLAIAALSNGDEDVVLGDLPTLGYFAVQNPDDALKIGGTFGDEELFGIAVRKDVTSKASPLPIASILVAFMAIPFFRKFQK